MPTQGSTLFYGLGFLLLILIINFFFFEKIGLFDTFLLFSGKFSCNFQFNVNRLNFLKLLPCIANKLLAILRSMA